MSFLMLYSHVVENSELTLEKTAPANGYRSACMSSCPAESISIPVGELSPQSRRSKHD
jgi:hypothetical protein